MHLTFVSQHYTGTSTTKADSHQFAGSPTLSHVLHYYIFSQLLLAQMTQFIGKTKVKKFDPKCEICSLVSIILLGQQDGGCCWNVSCNLMLNRRQQWKNIAFFSELSVS